MAERVVVRDDKARMRASSYLSLINLLLVGAFFVVPLFLIYGAEIPVLPALLVTIAMELAVVAIAAWYSGLFAESRWKTVLGFKNFSWNPMFVGFGVGLIFFIGLIAIEYGLKAFGVEVSDSDTSSMFTSLTGLEKYIVLFAFVGIIVPIVEEIFFRGYVFSFLTHGYGVANESMRHQKVIIASVFSSFVFAILHFQGAGSATDFLVLAWTFLFAYSSCFLRMKYKSLYPSMGAHAFYNSLSAIALAFL